MQRENNSDAEAVYISSQEKLLDWLKRLAAFLNVKDMDMRIGKVAQLAFLCSFRSTDKERTRFPLLPNQSNSGIIMLTLMNVESKRRGTA